MKKYSSAFAVCSAVLVLALPLFASAAILKTGETVATDQNGRIDDDVYVFGETISVKGAVFGDVYGAGNNIFFGGSTSGDLVAGGGSIHISGSVADDLRIAGGTLILDGFVLDDAMIAGGEISMPKGRVTGDMAIAGGTVRLSGEIGKNLSVRGGDVVIDGTVGGNVNVVAEKLTIGSNAKINGNLTYKAHSVATIQAGSLIRGTVDYTEMPSQEDKGALAAVFTVFAIVQLLTLIAGSLIFATFLSRYASAIAHHVHANVFLETFRGFVVMIVLPVFSFFLLFTVVGIPFTIVGLLAFIILIILGWLLAPIAVAGFLEGKHHSGKWHALTKRSVAFGAFLYWLIGFVPVIGGFVQVCIVLAALGATFKIKWDSVKAWR